MRQSIQKHPLIWYTAILFLFTWPIDLLVAAKHYNWVQFSLPLPVILSVGALFFLAVLVTIGLGYGKSEVIKILKRFLIWKVGAVWYLTILIMPAISFLAVLIDNYIRESRLDFSGILAYEFFGSHPNIWMYILPWFIFTSLTNLEEIGWRGFLLPKMQGKHSALYASILIGVVWWLWHLPKYLGGAGLLMFSLSFFDVLAKSILLTWLYNNTKGSLLLATLFHSSINTAAVFLPMATIVTNDHNGVYVISIILEIITAAFLVYFFGKKDLSLSAGRQIHI